MSRAVSLQATLFLGQAWSSKLLTSTCAHYLTKNWQLPILNQQKGDNDLKKYFMINLHERMLQDLLAIEPVTSLITSWMCIRLSNRARSFWGTCWHQRPISDCVCLCYMDLALVLLNKLSYNAHFQFSTNQITWPRLLTQIHIFND